MLKLQFIDNRQKPIWAMEKSFTIGRDNGNHLAINASSVDAQHAKLLQRDDTFILKDLGSSNGTFINGQRITQKNISCGDRLCFGDVELDVVDPLTTTSHHLWSLIADSSWLSGQEFPLYFSPRKSTLTIGRSTECDITIPGTHLSRQHAELSLIDENVIVIHDLESANGTFVNDQAVSKKEIKAGDRLRFDVYSFRLFGPDINLPIAATLKQPTIDMPTDDFPFLDLDTPPQEKRWKTKPTSVGNRTEEDLYTKSWAPTLLAMSLIASFTLFMAYLFSG